MRLTKHEFRDYFGVDVGAAIHSLLEGDGHYIVVQFGEKRLRAFTIDLSGDDVILHPVFAEDDLKEHYKRLI